MESVCSRFHLRPQLSPSETETEAERGCGASLAVCERHLMPRGRVASVSALGRVHRRWETAHCLPTFTPALPVLPVYVFIYSEVLPCAFVHMLTNLPKEFMGPQNGIEVPSCPLASVKFLVKCMHNICHNFLKPYVTLISISFLAGILFSTNVPSLFKAHLIFSICSVSLTSPPL